MTAHYDELSAKDAIFGQLRNCMDLAVVAALISKENLTEKCGWSMPLLMNPDLLVESYNAPHRSTRRPAPCKRARPGSSAPRAACRSIPGKRSRSRPPTRRWAEIRAKASPATTNWWWN